jgi:hypothetical protein
MSERGQWTRWGRGMCEGYSLELGFVIRGNVVRQHTTERPVTWLASMNATYLGEYSDREEAMARVEGDIEHHVKVVLEDWEAYRAGRRERGEQR